jgi:hypothetical protein
MAQDPGKSTPGSPVKQEQPPGKEAPGKDVPGKTAAPQATAPAKSDAPGKVQASRTEPAKTELTTSPAQNELPQQPPVQPLQSPPVATTTGVAAPPPAGIQFGDILIPALFLVAILVAGAFVLAWLKRNRQRGDVVTTTASDQLATFRHAYEEGEMTPEEFKKVKARLTEKLRERDPMSMPPQARTRRDEDPLSTLDDTV